MRRGKLGMLTDPTAATDEERARLEMAVESLQDGASIGRSVLTSHQRVPIFPHLRGCVIKPGSA